MPSTLSAIEVITLFVQYIDTSRAFYDTAFARPVVYEDEVSFVLQFDNLMVNVLQVEEAHELVGPRQASTAMAQCHVLLTIRVEDTDATCSTLRDLGVELINGPIDRPWGRRTAAFADPSGHVWEIAQPIGNEVPAG
ncbi:MAG: VOC family protein [Pseudomonadota bacterium]